jgi:hypothetical protein
LADSTIISIIVSSPAILRMQLATSPTHDTNAAR